MKLIYTFYEFLLFIVCVFWIVKGLFLFKKWLEDNKK